MSQKSFEEHIKNELTNHPSKVNTDLLWNNLNQGSGRKRAAWIWYALLGLLLLSGASYLVYNNYSSKNLTADNISEAIDSEEESVKNTDISSNENLEEQVLLEEAITTETTGGGNISKENTIGDIVEKGVEHEEIVETTITPVSESNSNRTESNASKPQFIKEEGSLDQNSSNRNENIVASSFDAEKQDETIYEATKIATSVSEADHTNINLNEVESEAVAYHESSELETVIEDQALSEDINLLTDNEVHQKGFTSYSYDDFSIGKVFNEMSEQPDAIINQPALTRFIMANLSAISSPPLLPTGIERQYLEPSIIDYTKRQPVLQKNINWAIRLNYGFLYPKKSLEAKDASSQEYLESREATESFVYGGQFNVELQARFKRHFYFSIGIAHEHIKEKFEFSSSTNFQYWEQDVLTDILVNESNDTTFVYDSVLVSQNITRNVKHYNDFKTLDITTSLGYIYSREKWHLFVETGPTVNLWFRKRGMYLNESLQPANFSDRLPDNETQFNETLKVGIAAYAGIGYNVHSNIQLTFRAGVKHHFGDITGTANAIQQNYTMFSFQGGMNFLFKGPTKK